MAGRHGQQCLTRAGVVRRASAVGAGTVRRGAAAVCGCIQGSKSCPGTVWCVCFWHAGQGRRAGQGDGGWAGWAGVIPAPPVAADGGSAPWWWAGGVRWPPRQQVRVPASAHGLQMECGRDEEGWCEGEVDAGAALRPESGGGWHPARAAAPLQGPCHALLSPACLHRCPCRPAARPGRRSRGRCAWWRALQLRRGTQALAAGPWCWLAPRWLAAQRQGSMQTGREMRSCTSGRVQCRTGQRSADPASTSDPRAVAGQASRRWVFGSRPHVGPGGAVHCCCGQWLGERQSCCSNWKAKVQLDPEAAW